MAEGRRNSLSSLSEREPVILDITLAVKIADMSYASWFFNARRELFSVTKVFLFCFYSFFRQKDTHGYRSETLLPKNVQDVVNQRLTT